MTRPHALTGYTIKAEITRGQQATQKAREALRRIVEEAPGQQTTHMLIARAALAIGEAENAFGTLERIASEHRK